MKVKKSDIKDILAVTFPEYTGRKFHIQARERITLHDLNWSGGTRNQYRACTIDGRPLNTADGFNATAPWRNPAEGATVEIPVDGVVVVHSNFCGCDCGIIIYVNPANMPRLLKGE